MGFIIDTGIENLGLERRKESYYIYELEGEELEKENSEIFAFGLNGKMDSPTLEITNDFLDKLLTYFENNPEERKKLKFIGENSYKTQKTNSEDKE